MRNKWFLTVNGTCGLMVLTSALALAVDLPNTYTMVGAGSVTYGTNVRYNSGTGPIRDSMIYIDPSGLAVRSSSKALVDATGLHVTATAFASMPNLYGSNARTQAEISNPFIVAAGQGFTGTTAYIEIPYKIKGTIFDQVSSVINMGCSGLMGCDIFHTVAAEINVTGPYPFPYSAWQFQWSSSDPGVFEIEGTLSGNVPVNTQLTLYANLAVSARAETFGGGPAGVGSAVLFPHSLSYTASSPDNVSFVWGLTPQMKTTAREADFNGDGKTDLAAFHLDSNQFFTDYSGNLGQYGWGGPDAYPLVWNYNGDENTDVSIYHIPTSQWFVKGYPGDNLGQFGWGGADSIPVPGDYNGDGVMERAFYHTPSNTFFIEEQGGVTEIQFGWDGPDCIPVPGDYDGDGKTDLMIYHIPSNQWLMYGAGNLGQYGWGGAECLPVPADYDGDGSIDIAVYHYPTNQWFVKGYPGDNLGQFGWGGMDSFPIPGDYNGDGIVERAFYRPSENRWFIERQPDFIWGWDTGNFMPITGQINVFNWFRFVMGKFQ